MMSRSKLPEARGIRVCLILVLLVLLGLPAMAQQTNNYVLRAVPAPEPITLDGKLDEWDLSGEIVMCYDLDTLSDTHSVRTAAMYDADYLYLSFCFRDRTPLVNHVDPEQEPGSGWRSDSVQLRIWADDDKPIGPGGGRITHIDCYWFTDEQRPAAIVQFHDMSRRQEGFEGKIEQAIGQGVDAAFLMAPDGQGYTQEMRVSWDLIRRDSRPYVAGEVLRLGIECFWGDATGSRWPEHRLADLINAEYPQREFFWTGNRAWGRVQFLDHGNLEPSPSIAQVSELERLRELRYRTEGPVKIHYKLPAEGSATLVIEKPDGTRVRNLIANYPRKRGYNTDRWDGTDDQGRLVPPGEYRIRGLCHGPLDMRYQFSYGNPGNPAWETSDGTGNWLSDHANPLDVLADDERIYVVAPNSENGNTLIALDYEGNRLWGLCRTAGGFMARAEEYLYMVADSGCHMLSWGSQAEDPATIELIRVDPETGKLASFPDGKSKHEIATWVPLEEAITREREGVVIAQHGHNADWCNIQAQGLAAIGQTLYVSMHFANKLLKVDAEQGEVIGEIPLDSPAGLASAGERLLAISGTQVVEVDPQTGEINPVVTEGLSAPIGLALDGQGNIYVSDWADQMCVKVFSSQGKFLRTMGKVGGRAWVGTYDPQAMLLPRGITVDQRGRLWVAEDDYSPRRVSCWNPDGRLALEKLGTTYYSGAGCFIFPDNPTRGIVLGNLVEIDWKRGQWRVLSTLWRSTHSDALLGMDYRGEPEAVIRQGGRTFLVHTANRGVMMVSELRGDIAVPLAAIGSCETALPSFDNFKNGERPAPIFADHLWVDPRINQRAKEVIPWYFDSPKAGAYVDLANFMPQICSGLAPWHHTNSNFVWADLNGNGRLDSNEVNYFAAPDLPPEAVRGWRTGWGWHRVDEDTLSLHFSASYKGEVHIWRVPVARWAESGAPVYDPEQAQLLVKDQPVAPLDFTWVDSQGNLLCNQIPLTMYTPEGEVAWSFPNPWPNVHGSHTAPKAQHGRLIGPLQVIGSAQLREGMGEIFCFSGNLGQAFLFTTDGLYLADLFRDCRSAPETLPDQPTRGMSIIQTTCGAEWFGGQFFRNPQDGKIYLVNGHSNINEVTGLDTVRRLPTQTIEFTQEQYEEAVALLARRAAEEEKARTLAIFPPRREIRGVPPQEAFDWRGEAVAKWQFDGQHSAEATWTYDEDNLYVCFRNVLDSTPMINGGKDPQILFKTGDAAVFELRPDPNAQETGIAAGDLRLLFSVFNDEPIAVAYRYKVPGTTEPVPFISPVTTTNIDIVKILDSAQIALDRQGDRYSLRAVIPLAELNFIPVPGKTYWGDFGIIYSDRAGRINELRMYWSNPVTGMVSDLAIEAAIEPRFWGRFELQGE